MDDAEKKKRARDRQRRWRLANPEKHKARVVRWKKKNKETYHLGQRERNRRHRVKKKYGLTLEQAQVFWNKPCEGCGESSPRMHIDHCHTTGKVRGALCNNCNLALGLLKENVQTLDNLKFYVIDKCLPMLKG